jgi:DNA-binding PadR family transcriptional regulator
VFVDMSQQRFVFLEKKGLVRSLGVVDTNICKHFIVNDRGRKTLQPWMFVCRC